MKNKIKKNLVPILTYCSLVSIFSVVMLFVGLNNLKNKEIQASYHEFVSLKTKANIYKKQNDKYQKIGEVSKDFTLTLAKQEPSEYYKVKNTDYYVYYKDIKKSNKIKKDETYKRYLPFVSIPDNQEYTFYKNDKKVLNVKEKIDLKIYQADDKYYYVPYLDNLLALKKDDITLKEVKDETKEASKISILSYPKVEEKCESDTCISLEAFNKDLASFKDYETISITEYESWTKNYLRLPTNSLVISVAEDSSVDLEKVMKENNLIINKNNLTSYIASDEAATKEVKNIYKKTAKTEKADFEKMLKGEKIEKKVVASPVSNKSSGPGILVLNYHFFFDSSIGEVCDAGHNCLDVANFRQHLTYFKDNGYKTLTMKEFVDWIYGRIELPEKSVLITVDDGAMGTGKHNGNKLIPLLEEFKMHATLFLITAWWGIENYQSPYLDVESHTHDMHVNGSCGDAKMLCLDKDSMVADLKQSMAITKSNLALCYPFFKYNDTSVAAVKEAGFQVAFAKGGGVKATRNSNKYAIPRYQVLRNTSLQTLINQL